MANYDNINLKKGSYDITLFTNDVTEGGDNQLTVVAIPTTKRNQETGQADNKVVDLLRIKNTFHIIAYITNYGGKLATAIKEELKALFKGAGENTGAPIVLTYDGLTYNVYAQKWVINKLHSPKEITTTATITDVALYMVTLDLVEGVAA